MCLCPASPTPTPSPTPTQLTAGRPSPPFQRYLTVDGISVPAGGLKEVPVQKLLERDPNVPKLVRAAMEDCPGSRCGLREPVYRDLTGDGRDEWHGDDRRRPAGRGRSSGGHEPAADDEANDEDNRMTTPFPPSGSADAAHLLLVEDDEVIRNTVRMLLERYGFTVSTAGDGLTGLEIFREKSPDLLLLDVMLPELDGIGLCRRVRELSLAPILMMSARGDALDVVSGLEAGADDYVVKPCESAVLVARIRSLLRRASFTPAADADSETQDSERTPAFGDLTIDTRGMEVRRTGRELALTPTELRMLLEFAASPGVVLQRRTLLSRVWDHAWHGDTRVVDLHVQRLRAKIGAERIETVRGFGYKLRR